MSDQRTNPPKDRFVEQAERLLLLRKLVESTDVEWLAAIMRDVAAETEHRMGHAKTSGCVEGDKASSAACTTAEDKDGWKYDRPAQ